jgi:hypothetical protein
LHDRAWREAGSTRLPAGYVGHADRLALGHFFVELDEVEHVLPDQPADGARAVHPNGNRTVGPQNIARAVDDLALLLIEAARPLRQGLIVRSVAHWKVDPALLDGLLGVLLRVHGSCNNLDPFFLKSAGSGKGRQLLLTVWSPVAPVQEHDAPVACQIARKMQRPAADLVDLEVWERIATIEHLVGHTWHEMPSNRKRTPGGRDSSGRAPKGDRQRWHAPALPLYTPFGSPNSRPGETTLPSFSDIRPHELGPPDSPNMPGGALAHLRAEASLAVTPGVVRFQPPAGVIEPLDLDAVSIWVTEEAMINIVGGIEAWRLLENDPSRGQIGIPRIDVVRHQRQDDAIGLGGFGTRTEADERVARNAIDATCALAEAICYGFHGHQHEHLCPVRLL